MQAVLESRRAHLFSLIQGIDKYPVLNILAYKYFGYAFSMRECDAF